MKRHTNTILISILLLISTLSYGQIVIQADTIFMDCRYASIFKKSTDGVVISSQAEFEKIDFSGGEGECIPFKDIDFEKSILAAFRYRGSNCDLEIQRSTVLKKGDTYVIQFSTPPSVCRDLSYRIVWFMLEKPRNQSSISLEKVNYK